jgi:hypothetical protein
MPSTEDVLSDIEFELAQGAISHDDLSLSIQAIARYQNKMRGELLQDQRRPADERETITRLFQINDMLIAMSQEMAEAIQSLRLDLRKMAQLPTFPPERGSRSTVSDLTSETEERLATELRAEIKESLISDALRVAMEVQPARLPVLGRILHRLRAGLHSIALFYTNRLAQKQAMVNQTQGQAILHLIEIIEHQQNDEW